MPVCLLQQTWLLSKMGFMMANFYLINWPDEDIKRISWEAVCDPSCIAH